MMARSELKIVALLAAINFVNIVDFMVLMPLAPQIKNTFQLNAAQWGSVVSAYTIAAFVSGILAIFMIDRFNRKKYLLYNMAGFIIGTFLCGIATSFPFMIFARIFAGFFGGVIGSVSISIITDTVPIERRGRAMGFFMGGFSAAAALGVPFGTVLGAKDFMGWNFPFLALAVIGILFWILSMALLPSLPPVENPDRTQSAVKSSLSTISEIFKDKNQLNGYLLMCVLSFAQFMIVPFFSPYLAANLGLNDWHLAGVYCVGGITSIIANPIIGKLTDRLGAVKVFTVMALLACIPMWYCTNMHDVPYPVILFAAAVFFAFVGGRFTPAVALMISTAKPHQRGIFNTLRNSVQNGTAGIAAFTAGFIVHQVSPSAPYTHYATAGYIAIVMNLTCIFLIRSIKAVS